MTITRTSVAALGLAALALATLVVTPPGAQPLRHLRHAQVHKAARLDRRAAHAAATGHPVAAHRMAVKAAHLRHAAHHGH